MQIVSDVKGLKKVIDHFKQNKKSIGFVPTMGALHMGHLSLIRMAAQQCEVVVISIFVNPTQFNNPIDLKNYPSTLNQDIALLEKETCHVLFTPSEQEMYPNGQKSMSYPLGGIDLILEGHKRPGHFDGVCTIVHRLFEIVRPNKAFFGEKDFQQLYIIQKLTKHLCLDIEIVAGRTIREDDGLAKSSRNMLLNDSQRKLAPIIYQQLKNAKSTYGKKDTNELKKDIENIINANPEMTLDYIEIIDAISFKPIHKIDKNHKPMVFIAVYLGKIRLIDNLPLID